MRRENRRQQVERRLHDLARRVIRVRADSLRSEEYGVLEASRIGRGEHWPGQPNPSSAPGDPPARQTGHLMESVRYIVHPTELRAIVGPLERGSTIDGPRPVPYAAPLEYGSLHVEPRPWIRPAYERWRAKWAGGGR